MEHVNLKNWPRSGNPWGDLLFRGILYVLKHRVVSCHFITRLRYRDSKGKRREADGELLPDGRVRIDRRHRKSVFAGLVLAHEAFHALMPEAPEWMILNFENSAADLFSRQQISLLCRILERDARKHEKRRRRRIRK